MKNALVTISALLLACATALTATVPASSAATGRPTLLRAVNDARAAHGLAALSGLPALRRVARVQARMHVGGAVLEHGAVRARLQRVGLRATVVGENLAFASGAGALPERIVAAWLASPAHRANLLSPRFRHVGFGLAQGPFAGVSGSTIVAAEFAG